MTKKEIRKLYGSETLDLYGKTFTWCEPRHNYPDISYEDLWDVYGMPSERKIAIWNDWQEWEKIVARDNNAIHMWVQSHNCNFFTIGGVIDTPTDEHYGFYITATRQEIWQILD